MSKISAFINQLRERARLGSARASRAGNDALAIANFFPMVGLCFAGFWIFLALPCMAIGQTTQQEIAVRAGLEQKLNAQVPLDAVFRDEHGTAVKLGQFFREDEPVILAFAYYECPNLCTLVLNSLLQTAQELRLDAGKDYEIVVVSFDPRERPALAAAKKQTYLERYGRPGASDGWHFLTGDRDAIARLTAGVGYHFAYDETTRQFAHPSAIMVLTPTGKIARCFPGIEYPPRDVRLALISATQERVGSIADRVFLLCFHYNPANGKYGLIITRVMQVAGIGSALALACYIVFNLRRDRRTHQLLITNH
jgi:protein SCO1/2